MGHRGTPLTESLKYCRQLNGRRNHRIWEPVLDPPALLSHVAVVLVGSKRPSSIGAAARACGCFEVQDLRLVDPRCDYLCRSSRNASKGAQHVLWRATVHQDLRSALAGAAVSVAFARWTKGAHNAFAGMAELLQSPLLADRLGGGAVAGNAGAPLKGKLVLVFGREVRGLDPEEIAACDAVCSIPIGRLQESLSLSHAVSLALAPLFEEGLNQGGGAALASSVADLVAGGEATGDL